MNIALVIGLGVGLAVAAGLRPFLPALVAGALGAAHVLGVRFDRGDLGLLQSAGWLIAVAVLLVAAYALQSRLGSERTETGVAGVALRVLGLGAGAILFAGTMSEHHDAVWAGALGGLACAALTEWAVVPLLARARARLPDRSARDALALYADGAAFIVAVLTCLLHPLGYLALLAVGWLALSGRRRAGEKYAGLRILRG